MICPTYKYVEYIYKEFHLILMELYLIKYIFRYLRTKRRHLLRLQRFAYQISKTLFSSAMLNNNTVLL